MKKISILTFLLVISVMILTSNCYPSSLDYEGVIQCYKRDCPARTTGCKKVTKTSDDKKSLVTTITCLDVQDMVLKEYNENEDNPYGPHTHYESTSFQGTYVVRSGNGNVNINIDNDVNGGNRGIEDFS